jgi:hypothetical protein
LAVFEEFAVILIVNHHVNIKSAVLRFKHVNSSSARQWKIFNNKWNCSNMERNSNHRRCKFANNAVYQSTTTLFSKECLNKGNSLWNHP